LNTGLFVCTTATCAILAGDHFGKLCSYAQDAETDLYYSD
jgi:hypothetical protein